MSSERPSVKSVPGDPGRTPEIACFTLGPFATNCYVVSFPKDGSAGSADSAGRRACWIVDASFGPGAMIEHIRSRGLRPEMLILTHAHADHIAGVEEVRRAFPGVPVAIHRAEADFLADPVLNLSAGFPPTIRCGPAERLLEGGETLMLGGEGFRVLHTPGHSPGGITLVHDVSGTALVGDTLFAGSVGRVDFPTSRAPDLVRSVREVLYRLADSTRVLPGHGPATTIGREKRSNPFVPAEGAVMIG